MREKSKERQRVSSMTTMKANVYDEKSSFASTRARVLFLSSFGYDFSGKNRTSTFCVGAPFLRPSLVRTFVRAAVFFRTPRRFRAVLLLRGPVAAKRHFISFSLLRARIKCISPFFFLSERLLYLSSWCFLSSREREKKKRERKANSSSSFRASVRVRRVIFFFFAGLRAKPFVVVPVKR